ncbi:MAG: DNA mismatch repair endonuclease MutL [Thermoplasmata archaeon]|nr:MAG: DNA mismatch repair endonuclease MutL [Thermoplasmata archaeon]RLF72899.1 MAG: DNA mismatch repair endonuclease MutL [Thermoplasmata archaeon]RLF74916.1 MAG: DNA mismatch repair endonuclease MutL [Thermoplasmata archaeon]HDD60230.1 DNA mismatch repair endonuclease MutL [Euryarchaeota archaeon]
MRRIRVLPGEVVKKIAAGEVIDGPHSVVKELVENSLDAGADEITVELEEGGRRRITVRDNGCGMGREDLMLAFQSHTTSKIKDSRDLLQVMTFGFRGEALASVAAVSRVEAISRENPRFFKDAEEEGTRVLLEEGRILKVEGAGHPPGTTIHVRDIFFNLPVRRRGLKSAATETGRVMDVLRPVVLAHPEVSFRVTTDGRDVLTSMGGEPLLQRLAGVFGTAVRKELFYLPRHSFSWGELEGYLSLPENSKRSSRDLIIIVNGRWVLNEELKDAIRAGYGRALMKGRHPWGLVMLKLDPRKVDVNVHPQKLRVKIDGVGEVITALSEAVGKGLSEALPPPESLELKGESILPLFPQEESVNHPLSVRAENGRKPSVSAGGQTYLAPGGSVRRLRGDLSPSPLLPPGSLKPLERPPAGEIRIIGQFGERYILLEAEEDLIVVDQHAASERVRVEEAERFFKVGGRMLRLIEPIYIELPPGRVDEVAERRDELKELGLDVEPFGEDRVVVRGIPAFIKPKEAGEVLRDFLEGYGGRVLQEERERLIDRYACKGGLKSGETLTPPQIRELIGDLLKAEDPLHCAHGRPTMLRIEKRKLDRLFGR